jgi:DNA-binding NarL/FixJ family response regulator
LAAAVAAGEAHLSIPVVLVEDLKHLRDMVTGLLAGIGRFEVVAEFGTEADSLAWLDDNPGRWRLAVVDLILEQGTGMAVIARCRDRKAGGARIVVFSDYATPGIRQHCLRLGADAVFQKGEELQAFVAWCATFAAQATEPPSSPEAGRPQM